MKENGIIWIDAEELELNEIVRTDKEKSTLTKRLDNLEKSIRTEGMLQPLVVLSRESKYLISAGNKRYIAGIRAGLKKFPCIVKDGDPEDTSRIAEIGLSENLFRQDLKKSEKIDAIRKVMGGEITHQEIAGATGYTYKQIQKISVQDKLCPEIRALLDDGKISSSATEDLAPLSPEKQIAIIRELQERKMRLSADNIRSATGRKPHPRETRPRSDLRKQVEVNLGSVVEEARLLQSRWKDIEDQLTKAYSKVLKIMRNYETMRYIRERYPDVHEDFRLVMDAMGDGSTA